MRRRLEKKKKTSSTRKREKEMWVAVRGTESSKAFVERYVGVCMRTCVCACVCVCTLGPLHIVAHTNDRGAREPCAFTNFWRHVHSHNRPRRLHTQAAGLSVHARIRLLIGACRDRLGATKFGAPHRKTPGAFQASNHLNIFLLESSPVGRFNTTLRRLGTDDVGWVPLGPLDRIFTYIYNSLF